MRILVTLILVSGRLGAQKRISLTKTKEGDVVKQKELKTRN